MIYVTLEHDTEETQVQKVQINSLHEAELYCDMMAFLGYRITDIEIKEKENVGNGNKTRGNRSILRTFLSKCLYQG
jgi:hypothetical protein